MNGSCMTYSVNQNTVILCIHSCLINKIKFYVRRGKNNKQNLVRPTDYPIHLTTYVLPMCD